MNTSPGIAERTAFGRPLDPMRDASVAYTAPRSGTMLLGRILMAIIFLVSGAAKLMDTEKTVGYMSSQGIPEADVLVYVAAFAEIAGALSILFGFLTRIGAFGLILFMVPATLIFHDFWAFSGEEQRMQMINFLKNVAIIGGLTMLVATGAGRYSIDAKLRAPKPA